ncbi:MFS transporter [Saccharopolyspora mangrovi]|uniref:MFS transporter n=1 Tax=Saccharopolyspora mangrovi TaxID=3082379 RepID=A0ABU6ADJ4_9PSEU|nr:MFS transporter [Saccharopolyspora sp. S2-29]MEB3369553.1 MFS transporter [Saccharopolyspora sp. S2-29]
MPFHRASWVAAVTALVIIGAGACATTAGLLVTPLHHEFGWPHGAISAAASVNLVLYGLTAPFGVAAMDRFGMRRVVAAALLLIASGAALTTLMAAPWQFVLGWGVLVGTGCGALATTFAALVADRWFAARRGLVAGVLTAATVFGQFALLPVFSLLVDVDWRAATGALVAVSLLVAPLAWAVLRDRPADVGLLPYGATRPEPPAASPSVARAVRAVPLRSGAFWLIAGTFAICGASTNGIMWTHFTPAAHDHGMPTGVASSLLAVIGVVNVLGTVGSGWLTDRLDPRLLLTGCYALRGISLALLPGLFGPSAHPGMLAFVVVFGLLDVATVPPTIALCRELYGSDGPIAFGWISVAHQLGAGTLALLGGLTRDLTGTYTLLWPAAATLCLAAAALATRIPHPAEPPARATCAPSPIGR